MSTPFPIAKENSAFVFSLEKKPCHQEKEVDLCNKKKKRAGAGRQEENCRVSVLRENFGRRTLWRAQTWEMHFRLLLQDRVPKVKFPGQTI